MTQRFPIPHEHGGWAMVTVPFFYGMWAGAPRWGHVLLFGGWLLLYLASYPLLQSVKHKSRRAYWLSWGGYYGAAALLMLIVPILIEPALLLFGPVLLLLVAFNFMHAKNRSERAILNDLCAILIFSIGGAAAYLFGNGAWQAAMLSVALYSFIFFAGSAFYVKSIFRERGNKRWRQYAIGYHLLALAVPIVLGQPLMALPLLFPAFRAVRYAGKPLRPLKAGLIEIAGSVQFLVIASALAFTIV